MAETESRHGEGTTTWLCGSPKESCSGRVASLSASLNAKGIREHTNSTEAFKCYRRYLLSQGYEEVDSRGFRPPGGGPILVLTKRSRFGAKMRPGKGNRHMPSVRHGGVIVG